jgi:hypothetical protein
LFNRALLNGALIFYAMPASKKKTTATDKSPPVIKTEGPLSEKDEQGQAIERLKELQKKAMKKWQRLKKQVINKFKK